MEVACLNYFFWQPMEDRFDKLVREANMKTAEENDRTNNTQRSSTSQLQNSASGVSDTVRTWFISTLCANVTCQHKLES